MNPRSRLRRWRSAGGPGEHTPEEVARVTHETELSLVSALQDSDTPSETLHDEFEDAADAEVADHVLAARRPIRRIIGALALGAVALLVARRRR